jgi:16S rRNA (cytosine1402-N4)-methyltransferase
VLPGGRWIDATLGLGGHAEAILDRSTPGGEVLGIDRDPRALELAGERLARYGRRFTAVRGNFGDLGELARGTGWDRVDGILLDLGISSMQVDDAGRGFSFRADAPIDMRMDPERGVSARELVNTLSRDELAALFRELGEEPRAGRIASAIVEARRRGRLETTLELAGVVARASGYTGGRTHPATRVFQALRMRVNDEPESLERALPAAVDLLREGGRVAVIAYHSLEDRMVKETFRRLAGACSCPPGQPVCTCGARRTVRLVNRRPVVPDETEVARNRRARSAKMRIAEKATEERP